MPFDSAVPGPRMPCEMAERSPPSGLDPLERGVSPRALELADEIENGNPGAVGLLKNLTVRRPRPLG